MATTLDSARPSNYLYDIVTTSPPGHYFQDEDMEVWAESGVVLCDDMAPTDGVYMSEKSDREKVFPVERIKLGLATMLETGQVSAPPLG